VAPSFAFDILGKGFNKISMLITVAALFVGVIFVAPLVSSLSRSGQRLDNTMANTAQVRRKQINSLWTIP
jgi:hypothetical protein